MTLKASTGDSNSMAHEITVTWDASPGPISGYNIYRGGTADNESNVPLNGSTMITMTSFVDNTVFPEQVYFYEVTAVLNGVESVD
jgi:fibronectin type 3 domain-containing protein